MESIDLLQNDLRVLGANGSKSKLSGTSCLQVSDTIVIDAGNIIQALGDDAARIEHIFLTHSHLDHIVDLAFVVERFFHKRQKSLKIYGHPKTLDALQKHYFNNTIWPDFTQIPLNDTIQQSVELIPILPYQTVIFPTSTIKAILVEHTVPTYAYVIEKRFFALLYAPDTTISHNIWEEIAQNRKIDTLMIDLSFPSSQQALADISKHLTPQLLKTEIKKLKRMQRELKIYAIHLKAPYQDEIRKEVQSDPLLNQKVSFIQNGAYIKKGLLHKESHYEELEMLTTLAKEKNLNKILERILVQVMRLTAAEGGTIYLKEGNNLHFKAVINKKLQIHNTNTANWPPIPLYTPSGSNLDNVSALCALKNEIINIPDVYHTKGFDFEGMKRFDRANNYRSQSMLVIPMVDHEEEVIGVLQLINKIAPDGTIQAFSEQDTQTALAYSAYCAIAITKNRLIEDLEKLLFSFLESIALAMDAKSSVGYGHINRVGKMMEMVAQGINEDQTKYKHIHYTKDQLTQIKLAAWMHDIGKIATPEPILNKATKLETTYDRIHEIRERFCSVILSQKLALQSLELDALHKNTTIDIEAARKHVLSEIDQLKSDLAYIEAKNLPSGLMDDDDIARIQEIAAKSYEVDSRQIHLLTEDEAYNLSIRYGTLNEKERAKINEHVDLSNKMLSMLNFPKKFKDVPKIAGMHHEKLNGKGYPNRIKGDEIPFEARLLAIVDIFEALTAYDRPYKRPKTLKESYKILDNMIKAGEIDGEIVDFLKTSGLFAKYAKTYLLPEQLDVEDALEC